MFQAENIKLLNCICHMILNYLMLTGLKLGNTFPESHTQSDSELELAKKQVVRDLEDEEKRMPSS